MLEARHALDLRLETTCANVSPTYTGKGDLDIKERTIDGIAVPLRLPCGTADLAHCIDGGRPL